MGFVLWGHFQNSLDDHRGVFKETRSVTLNICRKKNLFKSFVKIVLSYVFTINMFITVENFMEK